MELKINESRERLLSIDCVGAKDGPRTLEMVLEKRSTEAIYEGLI